MSVRIEHDTFGEIEVPADKIEVKQKKRSKLTSELVKSVCQSK